MADSNITKNALAQALKDLMNEVEFSKISVADICNKCGMNRKSFYYHFKDKYDLMNWIFDVEFLKVVEGKLQGDTWELLEELCNYFYENKQFYRKALKIKGQNSFEEHFVEILVPVLDEKIRKILINEEVTEFHVNFCIDAYLGAIKRWLLDKYDVTPHEFVNLIKSCMYMLAVKES